MKNTTRLQQIKGGRQVKQSDNASTFAFILEDANGSKVNLNGQKAHVVLYTSNSKLYWETDTTVKDSIVEFTLPGNLVDDDYILEISCNGYVFPSDENLIIKVNKGFAEYIGFIKAYAIKKATRDMIREETQDATKEVAKNLDYSQLKGEKGEPFTYDDFTPEQLRKLKGKAFTYDDFTPEQLAKLKGEKGEPFRYEDFTEEQLAELKGEKGDSITISDTQEDEEGNTLITFSDDSQVKIYRGKQGEKGEAFTYDDFTEEQLIKLKGEKGDPLVVREQVEQEDGSILLRLSDDTEVTIPRGKQGEKGEPLKFGDLTSEEKEELKAQALNLDDYIKVTDWDKKVDVEEGKGLSSNDYTDTDKEKLGAIPEDPKYTDTKYQAGKGLKLEENIFSVDETVAMKDDIPEYEEPDLSGYVKNEQIVDLASKEDVDKKVDKVEGKELSSNDYIDEDKEKVQAIPEDPKYTDTIYQAGDGLKLEDNTFSVNETIAKKEDIPEYKEPDLSEYIKKTEIDSYIQKVALEEEPQEGIWTNDGTYQSLRGFTEIPSSYLKDSKIYKVIMPNSIKTIGSYAFYRNNLESVEFNDNLESIGDYAFASNNLESVEFNDNLQNIGSYAFKDNNNLKEVTINKNTKYSSTSFPSGTVINIKEE